MSILFQNSAYSTLSFNHPRASTNLRHRLEDAFPHTCLMATNHAFDERRKTWTRWARWSQCGSDHQQPEGFPGEARVGIDIAHRISGWIPCPRLSIRSASTYGTRRLMDENARERGLSARRRVLKKRRTKVTVTTGGWAGSVGTPTPGWSTVKTPSGIADNKARVTETRLHSLETIDERSYLGVGQHTEMVSQGRALCGRGCTIPNSGKDPYRSARLNPCQTQTDPDRLIDVGLRKTGTAGTSRSAITIGLALQGWRFGCP